MYLSTVNLKSNSQLNKASLGPAKQPFSPSLTTSGQIIDDQRQMLITAWQSKQKPWLMHR